MEEFLALILYSHSLLLAKLHPAHLLSLSSLGAKEQSVANCFEATLF